MLGKIDALTRQYRNLVIKPDGSLGIGNAEQQKMMISSNFKPEDLIQDFKIFCQLPPFLIRTCIFPRDNVIIIDNALPFFDLWALKTIHYFNRHPKFRMQNGIYDNSIDNLETFVSLLLLSLQRNRYDIIRHDTPIGKVINDATEKLLPCFVYPFLESLVRKECNGILNPDGTIANINTFPSEINKTYYESRIRKNPDFQISNIGDELLLLTKSSSNPLKATIDDTFKEFALCINSTKDPYNTIKDARNGILHGDIGSKGAITVKYIIFLIYLSKIPEAEYTKEIDRIGQYDFSFW